jgi:orotate phosphoribosyltransferase-like protein
MMQVYMRKSYIRHSVSLSFIVIVKQQNKMKQIKLSTSVDYYPVGQHITNYFQTCKEIGDHINELFQEQSITLWCRGSSGAIISALVSQHIEAGVEIYHVKKHGEDAHQNCDIHHDINIIIDDLMATGETVEQIYNEMKKFKAVPHCIVMTGQIKLYKFENIFGTQKKNIKAIIAGYVYNF